MIKSVKKYLVRIISKFFNITIYRLLPFGIDPLYDIRRKIKGYQFKVIFDIGANIGQSINYFLEKEPDCIVYAFEPAQSSYGILEDRYKFSKKINLFNIAVGNLDGSINFSQNVNSDLSRIIKDNPDNISVSTQNVEIKKLDTICSELDIKHINFLKIDTEGYDLEVLYSASNFLSKGNIDFVQIEAGLNPFNDDHIPLKKFVDYLQEYKYFPFGYYEQKHDWKNKKMILRRCDSLFVSAKLLGEYNLF